MGASLAVILTNLWLKQYEPALLEEVTKLTLLNEDNNAVCPGYQKKVSSRLVPYSHQRLYIIGGKGQKSTRAMNSEAGN